MSARDDADLFQGLSRLETLVRQIEQGPESPARATARQLVKAALDLHRGALARLMEIVAGDESTGPRLIEAFARDPLLAGVLLLHDLHPVPLQTRVRAAVDGLSAVLRGQGATVALVAVADGLVHVRVEAEAGCGGVSAALRGRVEEAIFAAAPDALGVEIDMPSGTVTAFVPVEQVRLRPGHAPGRERA